MTTPIRTAATMRPGTTSTDATSTDVTSTDGPDGYDAVVVGGRLGGAATAMLLARRGARVLVLDRARRGTDTLSTHAFMRAGVHQLARWGLLDRLVAAGTPTVTEVRFHHPDGSITVPVKPGPGHAGLHAPRRQLLDAVLADAAEEAGAELRFGARVDGLLRADDGRVTGVHWHDADGAEHTTSARIVIGADGTRSMVAREVEAPMLVEATHASGVVYSYFTGLEVTAYEWGFAAPGGSGLIPTNDGAVLAFVTAPDDEYRDRFGGDLESGFWEQLAAVTPELAERLRPARRAERFHGFAGLRGYLRRAHGPGWALVGDAGYFKDPISAHGMTDALVGAELLANAVSAMLAGADEEQALAAYERRRDELAADLFALTDEVAAYGHTPDHYRELLLGVAQSMQAENDEIAGWEAASSDEAA